MPPASYRRDVLRSIIESRIVLPVRIESARRRLLDVRLRTQQSGNRTLIHLVSFQPSASDSSLPVAGTLVELRRRRPPSACVPCGSSATSTGGEAKGGCASLSAPRRIRELIVVEG